MPRNRQNETAQPELQERVDAIAILANGRLAAQGTVQALRERSRMPLRLRLRASPQRLDALRVATDAPGSNVGRSISGSSPERMRSSRAARSGESARQAW